MGGAGVAEQARDFSGRSADQNGTKNRTAIRDGARDKSHQGCAMGFRYSCGARRVAVLVFALSSLPIVARAQAVVRGVLYDDATGKPVSGAVMLVDPGSDAAIAHAAADSTGVFSLQVGKGTYQIAAVRPGYTSVLSAPMPLDNGERLTVRVPIAQNGDPQHRIGVTEHIRPNGAAQGQSASGPPSEFQSRRALGMGLHYDREELLKNGQNTLGEFLRTVPGLNVSDPNSMSTAQMSRDAGLGGMSTRSGGLAPCHVGWFVDGHRMDLRGQNDPMTDGLGSMRLETIEAVEVFRGLSEMPAQYADPDLRCGAIAVWTRRG